MKKLLSLLLIAAIVAGLLAACAGVPVSVADLPDDGAASSPNGDAAVPPADGPNGAADETPDDEPSAPAGEGAVKTGLSVSASLASSKSAAADADGLVQADITLVAVTVDGGGVIDRCVIDAVQAQIPFDAAGQLTGDVTAPIETKNERGDGYGMAAASSIGREWYQQAAAFADYCVGKTVDELRGVAVSEAGEALDADLAASVTIYMGDFLSGVEAAVANAQPLGAAAGDQLRLVAETSAAESASAGDGDGSGSVTSNIAAVTFRDDVITSCVIDAVQPALTFDAAGQLTGDAAAPVSSKNVLKEAYGMGGISSIGKEWYEQAAAFADYCVGKTVDEVTGMAVTEDGHAGEADLAASVTIAVGGFLSLLAKAG